MTIEIIQICCLVFLTDTSSCIEQLRVEVSQTPRYLYDSFGCSTGRLSTVRGVLGWEGDLFLEITIYLHLVELNFSKLLVVQAQISSIFSHRRSEGE